MSPGRVRRPHRPRPSYAELLLVHLRANGESYLSALARDLDLAVGAASVALRNLEGVGLVTGERRGAPGPGGPRLYYRAAPTASWQPPTEPTEPTEEN